MADPVPGQVAQPQGPEGAQKLQDMLKSGIAPAVVQAAKEQATQALLKQKWSSDKIDAYWGDGAHSPAPQAPRQAPTADAGLTTSILQHAGSDFMGPVTGAWQGLEEQQRSNWQHSFNPTMVDQMTSGMMVNGSTVRDAQTLWDGINVVLSPLVGAINTIGAPAGRKLGDLGVPAPRLTVDLKSPTSNILDPTQWAFSAETVHGEQAGSILGNIITGEASLAVMGKPGIAAARAARAGAMTAFRAGEIPDPSVYPNAVTRSPVSPQVKGQFPQVADYQTAAAQLVSNPEASLHVQKNMQDIWVHTGMTPGEQLSLARAHPEFKQQLLLQDVEGDSVAPALSQYNAPSAVEHAPQAQPPAAPSPTKRNLMNGGAQGVYTQPATSVIRSAGNIPEPGKFDPVAQPHYVANVDEALGVFERLETGNLPHPDTAISPMGAVGRFQIMPATARAYGFDPAKLTDRAYSTQVARTIVSDLYRKYNGNMDAMSIAYNAGPKQADRFLASGPGVRLEATQDPSVRGGIRYDHVAATRDESFLPAETQKYLANGRMKARGDAPEEAPPTAKMDAAGKAKLTALRANPQGTFDGIFGARTTITSAERSAASQAELVREGKTTAAPNATEHSEANFRAGYGAWDVKVAGMTNQEVVAKLRASGLPFDQILEEGDHVHVGFGPKTRGEVATMRNNKVVGPVEGDLSRPDGKAVPSFDPNSTPVSLDADISKEREALAESGGGDLSAANTWKRATDADLSLEIRSNLGEAQPPGPRTWAHFATEVFSELIPAKRVDDRMVQAGLYDRKDFGNEDAFRQVYGSASRAATFVRDGIIDGPDKKDIIPGSHGLLDAGKLMLSKGGNVNDFKAYLLAARTDEKATQNLRIAKAQARVKEATAGGRQTDKVAKTDAAFQKAQDRYNAKLKEAGDTGDKTVLAKAKKEASKALKAAKDKRDLEIKQHQHEFDQVIVQNERDLEKARENPGIDTGVNPHASHEIVQRDSWREKYEEAARMWTETNNGALDYAVKAGRYSAEQVASMKAMNTIYVSMRRLMGDDDAFDKPYSQGGFTIGSPLKRMEGSDRQIADPLLSTQDNLRAVIKSADANWARKQMVEMAQRNPEWAVREGLHKVISKTDPNDDIVEAELKRYGFKEPEKDPLTGKLDPAEVATWDHAKKAFEAIIVEREDAGLTGKQFAYYNKGKREVWQINDPDMAQLMRGGAANGPADAITRTMQTFAALNRAGITITPDFAGRSAMSHQVIQFINDQSHPPPFLTLIKGMTHVLKNDDIYKDMQAKGGLGAALVDMDRDQWTDLPKLMEQTGLGPKLLNHVTHPLQLAQLVQERLDAANRTGIYEHYKAKGYAPTKAASGARTAGIDYAERAASNIVNWYAGVTPFFRPKLLYMKNFMDAWHDRPWETARYTAMTVGIPTALMWAASYIQDQTTLKNHPDRQYSEIERWQKDYAMITPEIAGVRFHLRFPEGPGAVFGGALTRILDAMAAHNPKPMFDWASMITQQLPLQLPAILQPGLEVYTNTTLGTGRPIVPSSLQADSAHYQVTQNTSPEAKALSNLIEPTHILPKQFLSPIGIDHMIRGYTGTLGATIMKVLGAPFEGFKGAPWQISDLPFARVIAMTQTRADAQSVEDFYKEKRTFDAATADLAVARRDLKIGDRSDIAYAQKEYVYTRQQGLLNQVAHTLAIQRQILQKINDDTKLSDSEKLQHSESVWNHMVMLSRSATHMMDNFQSKHPPQDVEP